MIAAIGWFITRSLTQQIGSAVGQIHSASAELQAAATQQATGSKEQSAATSEITTTISELLATSRQIAESAQRVAQIADQTAGAARLGNGTVDLTRESIAGIRRQVDQIVADMLDLGKKSQEIGAVLDIVSELAEQTNILAINATIEAVGAGDSGLRFGVVADEIRKLADRVGGSTKEIRTLIDDVRSAVNTTVMATETGSKAVDAGSRQFGDVTSAFGEISSLVTTTTEAAREIELSTKQQTSAVEQVNVAIVNVAQASKETETRSGQTLTTASQLATLSKDLMRIIQPHGGRRFMAPDPLRYFRLEARELLEQFGEGLLALEKSERGAPAVQRLLRLAHTLKGAARVVKQPEIAEGAHAIEDELSAFRESDAPAPRALIEAVLPPISTRSARRCRRWRRPAGADGRPRRCRPRRTRRLRTVRADIAEMDALLEGVSEAHVLLNGLHPAAQVIEQGQHLADLLLAQLPHGTADHDRPSGGSPDRLHATAEALRESLGGLERGLGAGIDQMDRELRQLRQASAEQLRLAPVGNLFVALERTARDIAQALGKQVTFAGKGGDIRLDSHVIETVRGALIQIVRNAVAHGIEAGGERKAAGKPESGRVTVEVSRRGRRIVFECRDDGRGVDLDAVRRAAVQRGLLDPAAKDLGAADLVRVLLGGGISTSKIVTDVSGRGIGLDIVRETIARLGGEVAVRTDPGIGTTFELAIPPSLASMEALIVEAGGHPAAIPLDAVRRTLRIAAADISRATPGASILYEQKAIAFIPLSTALDGARWPAERNWPVVIVAGDGGLAAVGVDRLLGSAKVVMRPLPEQLAASPIMAGALLDAESNPQLVLDPDGLVAAAQRGDTGQRDPTPQRRPLLVVDDSLTTRMLERSILESAGYEVDDAVSAEEALDVVRRKPYALILVDVEMPGMDGFTFVERIRSDPILRGIPAILVTSRAAPEDRQRGRDAGAQGYIVKSEFDQAELLAMIKPLME